MAAPGLTSPVEETTLERLAESSAVVPGVMSTCGFVCKISCAGEAGIWAWGRGVSWAGAA